MSIRIDLTSEADGSNRPRGTLNESKTDVLDTLDRLLGCQACTKAEKMAALRECEAVAKRMADNIEQWERQKASSEQGTPGF